MLLGEDDFDGLVEGFHQKFGYSLFCLLAPNGFYGEKL